MKNKNIAYLILILTLNVIFVSCTPVSMNPALVDPVEPVDFVDPVDPVDLVIKSPTIRSTSFDYDLNRIKGLINSQKYYDAEKELINNINNNPGDVEARKLLAVMYFKTGNYKSSEKLIRSILKSNPGTFDFLHENIDFDIYYAFISSLLRQNKTSSAGSYISLISEPDMLNIENRMKYDLTLIEYDYRLNSLDSIANKIHSIFDQGNISNEQKLNLYYILASSQVKLNRINSALDNAIFLILNDYENKYTKKIKRLLDDIVNNASEELLDNLRSKITDGYRELAVKSSDNITLKDKILRAINTLENSTVTIEMKPDEPNSSFISKVRLYTDKDVTSIYITSKDSIFFVNPPLFDGKSLTLLIPGKKINSAENFSKSLPGSGVESIQWSAEADTVEFKVNLSSNLDITIERSSGEEFEKSDKLKDRYSLKINVYLPEQTTTSSYSDIDLNEDKYTIVIDPGHGGDDPGAIGLLKKQDGTRYTEKEMNLMLSKGLKKFLEDNGYRVFLTRDGDYYPSLHERNRIAQNRNADMFLSIHINSASTKNKKYWQTDRYYGSEMIVRESLGIMPEFVNFHAGNLAEWKKQRERALKQHKKLSEILSRSIPSSLDSPYNKKRKIKAKNLVIFSGMTITHALIEAGFIINDKNLKYLISEKGQNAFYEGILKGIEEYRKSSL